MLLGHARCGSVPCALPIPHHHAHPLDACVQPPCALVHALPLRPPLAPSPGAFPTWMSVGSAPCATMTFLFSSFLNASVRRALQGRYALRAC